MILRKSRFCLYFLLIFCAFIFAGCSNLDQEGKGADSGDATGDVSGGITGDTNTDSDPGTATTPVFDGFDISVEKGTFWKFGWEYYRSTSSGFSATSSETEDSGKFWLELGDSIIIDGITMYTILIFGETIIGDKPKVTRWQYLGFKDHKIYVAKYESDDVSEEVTEDVSTDSLKLVELFDAQDGKWPGSGFFTAFDSEKEFTGYQDELSIEDTTADVIIVSSGSSSDQCSYDRITGITFCDDEGSSSNQRSEYYRAGLGVTGYYQYSSYSELTYDQQYSSSTEIKISLLGSSLSGDIIDRPVQITSVSPDSGTYSGEQTITVSTIPVDATIRYTTDGTDPSQTNGVEVSGTGDKTFDIKTNSEDLRIIAYAPTMSDSPIETLSYIIINAIDFVEDENGYLQVYNNKVEEYDWTYYDLRDASYTSSYTSAEIEVNKMSGSIFYGVGMIFGATDKSLGSYYYFLIAPSGHYSVYKIDGTGDSEIFPWTTSTAINAGLGQLNKLKVDISYASGSLYSLEFFINETSVNTASQAGPFNGYSGFIAFIGTSDYEEFPEVPVDVRFRMLSPAIIP